MYRFAKTILQDLFIRRYQWTVQLERGGHEHSVSGVFVKFAWQTTRLDGGIFGETNQPHSWIHQRTIQPLVQWTGQG